MTALPAKICIAPEEGLGQRARAMREPGESYSDVILRIAGREGRKA
jgi:hypothetical protein